MSKVKGMLEKDMMLHPELYNGHAEHADIDEDDSWDNNPDDGSWKGR